MAQTKLSLKKIFTSIAPLLFFIIADQAALVAIIEHTSAVAKEKWWLLYLLFALQIICAPLQAGFSDYFNRRKSLLVSISITFFSILLINSTPSDGILVLIISLIIKGIAGNTIPIAFAGFADATSGKHFRFCLALSICAYALGSWGQTTLSNYLSNEHLLAFIVLIMQFIALFIALVIFKDHEDRKTFIGAKKTIKLIHKEFHPIFLILKSRTFLLIVSIFFFSEIGFYQLLYRQEILRNYYLSSLSLQLGIGCCIGTLILKLSRLSNFKNIIYFLSASFLSLIALFLSFDNGKTLSHIEQLLFVVYSIGIGVSFPCLFYILSEKKPAHEQGKVYGIMESSDTIASTISYTFVMKSRHLSISNFISYSVLITSISMVLLLFLSNKYKDDCNKL